MQSEIWYLMNQQRNNEMLALAEQERLARLITPMDSPLSAVLLFLANILIAGGQALQTIAQRSNRKAYQTATPCR